MKKLNRKHLGFIFSLVAGLLVISTGQAAQLEQAFTTAYRYDAAGRVTGTILPDPDGSAALRLQATRNTYNPTTGLLEKTERGELLAWQAENILPSEWTNYTTFNVFSTQVFTYDGYGRAATSTVRDKAGVAISLTQTNYDASSRVNCRTVRMNAAYFNSPGSLPDACVLGAEGKKGPDRITQYTYNEFDQVVTESRAVGTPLSQIYVTNGYVGARLASQTDANGNRTELRYDDSSRLTRMVYPSLTAKNALNEADYVEFTNFDANGNARTHRKRNGALIHFTFDNNKRMILKDYVDNTKQRDIYYDYDLRGLQTLASFGTSATADRTTQKYDGFGNLTADSVTMSGVSRTVYGKYDLNNNRTRVNHGDNYFTYEFDGLNRMGVLYEGTGNRILQIDYNPDGHRKRIYRGSLGAHTNYIYTNGIQLNSFTQDFPNNTYDLTNTFQYNPARQISRLSIGNDLYYYKGDEKRKGVYEPDNLNRYSKVAGQPMGYDGNSNLTNDGSLTYQYDDENRLISTGGAVVSAFTYDPRGRLFQYQVTTNGVLSKTQFLYDGDALAAEFNGTTGSMQRRYLHGDRVDEPLVQYNSNALGSANWRLLHADHQGSIIAHSSGTGSVLSTLAYDAYGIPAAGNTDRFGYTGQIWLKELGLFHYKARVYHPKLGRFLQTDPIGYKDNMNLYAYVGNDPINNRDPTGLKCEGSGSDSKCTIDQVNIGTKKEANWVNRADGIKSGRVSEKQLGRLEGSITKGYMAAQKLGANSVTIKGAGGVKDILVTGNQVAGALGKATLKADNQSIFDRPKAIASTSPNYENGGSITFNNRAFERGNDSQTKTTVHESLHLLEETSVWNDNSKYRELHQQSFGDAAAEIIGN